MVTIDEMFQRVEFALQRLGCDAGAAACHGMLCGMMCDPRGFDQDLWINHLGVEDDLEPGEECEQALLALAAYTFEALEQPEESFRLLLPDDETSLPDRASAFIAWCEGFLSGFGLSGPINVALLGDDAREFLDDLQKFVRLSAHDVDGEDDERALFELVEFARVGAVILREEMYALTGNEPSTLH